MKGQNSFTFGIKEEKRCPRLGRIRRAGHWIWTNMSLFFLQNQLADTDEHEQVGPAGRRVKGLLLRGLKRKEMLKIRQKRAGWSLKLDKGPGRG